jgi:DNA polymerase alpha subunit A
MSVYGRRCVSKERCRGEMKLDVSSQCNDRPSTPNERSLVAQYSDQKLYNQLLYYASLFDVDRAIESSKNSATAGEDSGYHTWREVY